VNPYALDQQNYADAVAKYQQHASHFNRQATAFNNTIYKDPNGAQAGMVNGQWTGNTPGDLTGYGLWTTSDGQRLLRTAQNVQDAGQATMTAYGRGGRGLVLPNGQRIGLDQKSLVAAGYLGTALPTFSNGAKVALQTGTFTADPGKFTETQPVAPEATVSQQAGATPADVISQNQRGLISEVLASKGVR
jgi:hypothetical protein